MSFRPLLRINNERFMNVHNTFDPCYVADRDCLAQKGGNRPNRDRVINSSARHPSRPMVECMIQYDDVDRN